MATPPRRSDLPTLKGAAWLTSPLLLRVIAAIESGGGSARVIGGAVRNALLGLPIADVDVATDLVPEAVIERVTTAGLAVYPTGIEHGTVTVASGRHAIEVTTLRRDVETDGRRAVVAFTRDWHEDALRRDFTINALSCDLNGRLFDSVGGLDDLAARRVRFIGQAEDRIREDYLRILRFFRFTAAYAVGDCDAVGLAACVALKDGIARLSAERIGAEMTKFIVAPRACEIAGVMHEAGILKAIVALDAHPERLSRVQAIEQALGETPDVITRLAALFLEAASDASRLAHAFRLSNADRDALAAANLVNPAHNPGSPETCAKAHIYRTGGVAFGRAVRVAWARSGAPATDPAWMERSRLAATWSPPRLPFSGGDVMALGVPAGPRIGRTLRAFEAWWIEEDFPVDHDAQLARLAALAQQS